MDKGEVVCLCNGILLSHKKKNEILPSATTWMGQEGIVLSGVSQTEKQESYVESREQDKQTTETSS